MFLPEPLLAEEEAKLGSRRAIAEQPGWPARFEKLRALAVAPERGAAALPELRAGLAETDAAARWWAIQGLMRLEAVAEDTPRLEALLADESAVVRIVAALAVAKRGGTEKALPVLIAGLRHEEEWTRLAAAHALEALGRAAAPAKAALEEAAIDPPRQRGYRFNYVSRVSQRALSLIG
jgi:HEAT repeat protein